MDPKDSTDSTPDAEQNKAPDVPAKKRELTAEEQMAAFEEDLKETDWGHQPC
jgi:hypothetical protein